MYIDVIPNRNSPPAVLLREGRREGKKIIKRTLANISRWSAEKIEALRCVLKGEYQKLSRDKLRIIKSVAHGHVQAIVGTMKKLGLAELLYSKPRRERQLVMAMIAEQLIHPCSKLGYVRIMPGTTLLEELGLKRVKEDDLYSAMDWLWDRHLKIERRLVKKHLTQGAHVLYDVTSSYYEGACCVLAQRGHNRDKKTNKKIIVYGMMTDDRGCPVAVDVFPGNVGDPSTVPVQVEKLRTHFDLQRVVLVGDRGMLTQTNIDYLKTYPGIGWISALRSEGIRKLVEEGSFQPTLFDKQDLAEVSSRHYPGERLVVCYNPLMAEERKRKRNELLSATEEALGKIAREVQRRKKKLHSAQEISLKVGRVINRYKVGKHFGLEISKGKFIYMRKKESISEEAMLDGFYVIRTSESAERLSAEDTVRRYKSLSKVEAMFRTMKGVEILVRPIRHRREDRVKAHIFLCMLAYYVEWHMRQKLAPILLMDEETEINARQRHPVSPAEPSLSARKKKAKRTTPDGIPLQSFQTLLTLLATLTKNTCCINNDKHTGTPFQTLADMTPLQQRAFELLELCSQ